MKKTGIFLIAAAIFVGCTACQPRDQLDTASQDTEQNIVEPDSTKPDGAIVEILNGVKAFDSEQLEALLPEEGISLEQYVPVEFHGRLAQALGRMDYTVTDVRQDGNTAQVMLDITAIQAESAMNDAIVSATTYLAKQKLAGKSTEDYRALARVVVDALDIESLPLQTEPATAYMVADPDGTWSLDMSNTENLALLNAASGGALEIVEQFQSLANQYGINMQ